MSLHFRGNFFGKNIVPKRKIIIIVIIIRGSLEEGCCYFNVPLTGKWVMVSCAVLKQEENNKDQETAHCVLME